MGLKADPPFGTWGEHDYRVQPLELGPGDRLVFLTDGMLERNTSSLDIEALVAPGAQMHSRAKRCSISSSGPQSAPEAQLKDDATVMCLDWHGGSPRLRASDSGADP